MEERRRRSQKKRRRRIQRRMRKIHLFRQVERTAERLYGAM